MKNNNKQRHKWNVQLATPNPQMSKGADKAVMLLSSQFIDSVPAVKNLSHLNKHYLTCFCKPFLGLVVSFNSLVR